MARKMFYLFTLCIWVASFSEAAAQRPELPPISGVVAEEADILVEELIGKDGIGGNLKDKFDKVVTADTTTDSPDNSARSKLLLELDGIATSIPSKKKRVEELERLLADLQSRVKSPTRDVWFALGQLASEVMDTEKTGIQKISSDADSWKAILESFESDLNLLRRLSKVSTNPNISLALSRYEPKLDDWNVHKKKYVEEADKIQRDIKNSLVSLKSQVVGSLEKAALQGTGEVRTFASNALLRLAVYKESKEATASFLKLVAGESTSETPAFLASLESVHLLNDFKLETAGDGFSKVDPILAAIVASQPEDSSSPKLSEPNQARLTRWVRRRLVLDSFNKMFPKDQEADRPKFEARYLALDNLLKLMATRLAPSQAQEIETARAELLHIRYIGPYSE